MTNYLEKANKSSEKISEPELRKLLVEFIKDRKWDLDQSWKAYINNDHLLSMIVNFWWKESKRVIMQCWNNIWLKLNLHRAEWDPENMMVGIIDYPYIEISSWVKGAANRLITHISHGSSGIYKKIRKLV